MSATNTFLTSLTDYYIAHRDRFHCDSEIHNLTQRVFSLCSAIINDDQAASHLNDYIQIAETTSQSTEESQLILCMVWATLTLRCGNSKQTKLFLNELYKQIRLCSPFRLWNNFASSMHQRYGYLSIRFDENNAVTIHPEVTTAQQAQDVALQAVPQCQPTIHQTLLFPNVQQFNNNPHQVINNPNKNDE